MVVLDDLVLILVDFVEFGFDMWVVVFVVVVFGLNLLVLYVVFVYVMLCVDK